MIAALVNLTGKSMLLGGSVEDISHDSSGLQCDQQLPAPTAHTYYFVPRCMAAAAGTRMDVVFSPAIPDCSHCAAPPAKRHWYQGRRSAAAKNTLVQTVEHQTAEDGRLGVGALFFRQRYLAGPHQE